MMRPVLMSAVLTGVFCAAFAFGIDWLTDMLSRVNVIAFSFVSGFTGSLFANVVMAGRIRRK